jgi:microcystin degradation protein MlrC
MRAVVGGIVHESSTFASGYIGDVQLADFAVHSGADLLQQFTGTNTVVGGYLSECADAGVSVVPAVHARAEPAGAVSPEAYGQLRDRLVAALDVDCELVLLDLHGAGVVAPDQSLESDLLGAVRAAVGPRRVVAVCLDLHANMTPEMCELADVVVGFHEYPHVDMARRARRAARIAIELSAGRLADVHIGLRRLPMVLPPSPTDEPAAARLRGLVEAAEAQSGVLACSAFHGFPYADTPQAGSSIVTVVTGNAPTLGDSVGERIGGWLWQHRDEFLPATLDPAQAVATAAAVTSGPVIVGDAADNPGGGGSGDGTYLLRAILDHGGPACFATLHDPAVVRQAVAAGVGAILDVRLGGRHREVSGPPVAARSVVRALTDGRVVQQSVRRGKTLDFGQCAWLRIGALDLVVASERRQVFDPAILLLHGIDPARYRLVAVKSAYNFRSGFSHLNGQLLAADSLGLTTRRIESLGPRGPSSRLWPMNVKAAAHEKGSH